MKTDYAYLLNFSFYQKIDPEIHKRSCIHDMCRCTTLEVDKKEDIYHTSMVHEYGRSNNPIERHVLERILSRLSPDDFEVNIRGGYYGEELDSITCEKLDQDLETVRSLSTDSQKIEFWLKEEYGHVLDRLKDRAWNFVPAIDISQIKCGMDMVRTDRETIKKYETLIDKDKYEPVLLCEYDGVKYRLIDGRHRLIAAQNLGKKTIDIIVAGDKNEA